MSNEKFIIHFLPKNSTPLLALFPLHIDHADDKTYFYLESQRSTKAWLFSQSNMFIVFKYAYISLSASGVRKE